MSSKKKRKKQQLHSDPRAGAKVSRKELATRVKSVSRAVVHACHYRRLYMHGFKSTAVISADVALVDLTKSNSTNILFEESCREKSNPTDSIARIKVSESAMRLTTS